MKRDLLHPVIQLAIHTRANPLKCDLCEKGFIEPGHLNLSKFFKCNLWEKGCNQSESLTSHKGIHTEAKPIICDLCEKRFNRSDHLTKHKISHTGEEPFKCDLCDNGFTDSSNLFFGTGN